jgi:hypothetical protein
MADEAVAIARCLLRCDPLEFVRWLPVIAIEDALAHPHLAHPVWLMAALGAVRESAGGRGADRCAAQLRRLTHLDEAALLAMVRDMASCPVSDPIHRTLGRRRSDVAPTDSLCAGVYAAAAAAAAGVAGQSGPSNEANHDIETGREPALCVAPDDHPMVAACLIRAAYGGMAGDVAMLRTAANVWRARLEPQRPGGTSPSQALSPPTSTEWFARPGCEAMARGLLRPELSQAWLRLVRGFAPNAMLFVHDADTFAAGVACAADGSASDAKAVLCAAADALAHLACAADFHCCPDLVDRLAHDLADALPLPLRQGDAGPSPEAIRAAIWNYSSGVSFKTAAASLADPLDSPAAPKAGAAAVADTHNSHDSGHAQLTTLWHTRLRPVFERASAAIVARSAASMRQSATAVASRQPAPLLAFELAEDRAKPRAKPTTTATRGATATAATPTLPRPPSVRGAPAAKRPRGSSRLGNVPPGQPSLTGWARPVERQGGGRGRGGEPALKRAHTGASM